MVDAGGKKTSHFYETEKQARQVIRAIARELGKVDTSVTEAIDAYEVYMREEKGNRLSSVKASTYRVRSFFVDSDAMLADLTKEDVAKAYDLLASRVAVDTHRNTLAEVRTFFKWCVTKKSWIERNPLDGIEGRGKRKHGKAQLRIDEARVWLARAEVHASSNEWGALAAMTTLLLGLRASEVVSRVVRDVDDEGGLLWIPDSKTAAGRRTVTIPPALRKHFLRLVHGRGVDELLFGARWRDWPRKWVQRICDEVGVPKVSAHGMRGLHSTLAVASGMTGHAVAAALGHESFTTTTTSYAQAGAVSNAKTQRVLHALSGSSKRARRNDDSGRRRRYL